MQVWNVPHAARWKYRTQKWRKNCHLRAIAQICRAISSQLRHVSTIGKQLAKQQYVFHMFSQYGELRPTNGWDRFWSFEHPIKFQQVSRLAFVTAATSLTGGQPNFARCLAVSWTGTLYIHFRGSCLLTEFCPVQNSLYVQVLHSPIYWQRYCTALQQRASAKLCSVVQGVELRNFRRGRHLYSVGWPPRWASAHILGFFNFRPGSIMK